MSRGGWLAPTVLGLAGASLALLLAGGAAGWLPHGAQPPRWSAPAWAALFLLGWALMTGAMMLPSALPFLAAAQRLGGASASVAGGLGFAAVWLCVGLLFWAALWLAGGLLAGLAPGRLEQLAAASLGLAALYQLSPLAQACQRSCARPFALLAQHWHGGHAREAGVAGLHYGLSCVGCCLPMLALMGVVGMHDLLWLLALSALMLVQKHRVWGRRIAWPAASALAGGGLALGMGWWQPALLHMRALCGV